MYSVKKIKTTVWNVPFNNNQLKSHFGMHFDVKFD